jgi:drug/metabolite transporter (DMT)-like permease
MRYLIRAARGREVIGCVAAFLAVLIFASYPVATRGGVTGSFTPQDLIVLRFGVGALFFLPYLALHFPVIQGEVWLRGIFLAVFQGAGMAGLVIFGLQLAPANHAAALGPGISPAWVALLGFLIFSKRPSTRIVLGAIFCCVGVLVLAYSSASNVAALTLAGDMMFVGASALGALYVLQLRNWGINAMQGAAIVTLYSALIVVPWYAWFASGSLWNAAPMELLWQILWQGLLIGCVALIAMSLAIARLGSERSSVFFAFVPVLSAILGLLFLGEIPSGVEIGGILAISLGVAIGAYKSRAATPLLVMRQQRPQPEGYPVPGTVP